MSNSVTRRGALLGAAAALAAPRIAAAAASADPAGAHGFSFATLERRDGTLALSEFAGRPLLVVNTASRCGFTPQYEGLQALWSSRKDRGLVVIGAPSRDFGRQEFEDEGKIRDFCEAQFEVDFPMTELVQVKGRGAHPFYRWAEAQAKAQDLPSPRWNFHKYLVGPDGRLAGAWDSEVKPRDPDILAAIDALLPG
ncbi:glutathione peroxidase [Rhodovulum sp. DZ06]|uniref:glutathione peroxidase n=1 Tax=Rhodovulum sp. DZ06 TaxID=3425126 RepID=UPI003D3589A6